MEERKIVQYHAAIIGIGHVVVDHMKLEPRQAAIVLKAHELLAAGAVAEKLAKREFDDVEPPTSAGGPLTEAQLRRMSAEVFEALAKSGPRDPLQNSPFDRFTSVNNSLVAAVFDRAIELLETAKAHGVTHAGEGILRWPIDKHIGAMSEQKRDDIGGDPNGERDIKLPRGVVAAVTKDVLQEALADRYVKEYLPLYNALHGRVKLSVFNKEQQAPS